MYGPDERSKESPTKTREDAPAAEEKKEIHDGVRVEGGADHDAGAPGNEKKKSLANA